MKKNYFLTMLMVFASLTTFSQLGTDVYTLGQDDADNYGGGWSETTEGTGFSNWVFDTNIPSGGFAGRFTASFSAALDVSGNSFGLFANSANGTVSGATSTFPKSLEQGDSFKVSVGVNFRDGNKGFDLRNSSNTTIINFSVSGDKYNIAGTDLYSDEYDANTVITFTFTQNSNNVSWVADRTGGRTETQSGTIAAITPGTINNIRLYNTSAGTNNDGGSGQRNLFFNSFDFKSLYTINNNTAVTVTTTATVPYLNVQTGSSVSVNSGIGLTISGNLTNNAAITTNHGSSLLVEGTSSGSGNLTHNVSVADTNWHFISSPVVGEQYNDDNAAADWVSLNNIATGTDNTSNKGIGTYDNGSPDIIDSDGAGTTDSATGYWRYFQDGGAATDFDAGKGYSLKRTGAGDYSFTGTYPNAAVNPSISQGTGLNATNWNLIGNPYPTYIDIAQFITANTVTSDNLSDAHPAVYFWDAGSNDYTTPQTTGKIYPGQAFFVNSKVNGTASITTAMRSHNTGVTFYKSSNPTINLSISNGSHTRTTQVNYLDGKTASLDKGFDLGIFDGVPSKLSVYTELINNNEGVAFAKQALPNSDYESMVVPVGVIADAGEITFSAEALNLPSGLKVFLEDRAENTFTRLDEANSTYKATIKENGIGRFYIHTAQKSLSTADVTLENVSMYTINNNTLKIVGLSQGTASIKMFNVLGKQVLATSFQSNGVQEVSLPKLSAGLYIVQLESENGKLNKKIVLE